MTRQTSTIEACDLLTRATTRYRNRRSDDNQWWLAMVVELVAGDVGFSYAALRRLAEIYGPDIDVETELDTGRDCGPPEVRVVIWVKREHPRNSPTSIQK